LAEKELASLGRPRRRVVGDQNWGCLGMGLSENGGMPIKWPQIMGKVT